MGFDNSTKEKPNCTFFFFNDKTNVYIINLESATYGAAKNEIIVT